MAIQLRNKDHFLRPRDKAALMLASGPRKRRTGAAPAVLRRLPGEPRIMNWTASE